MRNKIREELGEILRYCWFPEHEGFLVKEDTLEEIINLVLKYAISKSKRPSHFSGQILQGQIKEKKGD
mgnify:CR=1 FL=1